MKFDIYDGLPAKEEIAEAYYGYCSLMLLWKQFKWAGCEKLGCAKPYRAMI